jgi:methionine sulfoxide reductase heme-binding subunit
MTLLAITSNDWSIKQLKNNWAKLHQLTYIILLILPWHIFGQMSSKWSYLTPFGLIINAVFIYFFIKRKIMENNQKCLFTDGGN